MFHLQKILLLLTSLVSFSVAASFFDFAHEPRDQFSLSVHRPIYDVPGSAILWNSPFKDAMMERMELSLSPLVQTKVCKTILNVSIFFS